MKLLPALLLCLTLPCLALAEPTFSSRPLSPADCAVMQEYLHIQGHRIQVESGELVIEGQKVVARLQCRVGQLVREWGYLLGEMGRREALERK